MTAEELDYVAQVTAEEIRAAVASATAPLLARLAILEARMPMVGPMGLAGENGKDGRDGRDGKDGKDGQHGRDGMDGAAGPVGEKGLDGVNGRDGFNLEDFDVTYDGERSLAFTFQRGESVLARSFSVPFILDRGVFERDLPYVKGDAVTWGGSLWIAQEPTSDVPGTSKAWRLAAKRGRDGKEGKSITGPAGPKGDPGPAGRNGY